MSETAPCRFCGRADPSLTLVKLSIAEGRACDTERKLAGARTIIGQLLTVAEYARNHFAAADKPAPDQLRAREVQLVKAFEAAIAKATKGE